MSIAVITGASSGLGIEFIKNMSAVYPEICEYWVIARRAERLEALKDQYPDKKIVCIPLDLTDESSFEKLDSQLKEANADVKLLINNAGLGKYGDFKDSPLENHKVQCDLNVRGLTLTASVVLKYMHEGSAMINVCSIAAFVPNANLTVYSSTKAYVYSFSKALRYELKSRKINVMAVCPGPMETEFLSVADITGNSKKFQQLPYCKPEKVSLKALKAAKKGKSRYTNLVLYKFYRILAKVAPDNIMLFFAKA